METVFIETPDGIFAAHFSERGLARLDFPEQRARAAEGTGTRSTSGEMKRWRRLTEAALKQLLAGRPPAELPPLDLSSGTPFQQSVWHALRKIGVGKTSTYSELAAAAGRFRAVRAAGGACGANPIPVLVPCHRVLAKGRGLGGFSGGLEWKRRLLEREGVLLKLGTGQ